MKFDLEKKHCYFFNELTRIPRGSTNEKAVSEFIIQFAAERNLRYITDNLHNVIVYKEGSKGRENENAVILQAHTDMVCEKNNDIDFDFEKDALNLYTDGDWLKAKGTTLGADDGFGVAYMLAILDDDSLSHPPLECAFTVQEEIGLVGAKNLKAEYFTAKRYINLDGGGEIRTVITNSGGRRTNIRIPVQFSESMLPEYRLFITGLKGGHSGGKIHTNLGNSNKIMGAILNDILKTGYTLQLHSIEGGLKENAIPREACAVFASDAPEEKLHSIIDSAVNSFRAQLNESDPGLKYTFEACEVEEVMSAENSKDVIHFIFLALNGMIATSNAIPGLTLASLNMGVVKTCSNHVDICFSIRSPIPGYIQRMSSELDLLSELCHGTNTFGNEYPGWSYDSESKMREVLASVIKKHGEELKCVATHGGLECGFFKAMIPDLDIITYGPISEGEHTPEEKLNLLSFDRSYQILIEVLESC